MSNNGSCGRPWTPYEDELLRAAVAIYGDNTEKWKTIALSVPARTNKACRKRWLHSLSPTIKKSAWTPEEDQLLLSLFEKFPNKWSRISREIPGRTDDACSKRYREALDPNLKKDEWTEEEDKQLLNTLMRYGGAGAGNPKWGLIGQELRRGGLACRNRWRLLERRKKNTLRQNSSSDTRSGTVSAPQFVGDAWPLFPESDSYWAAVFNTLGTTLENSAGTGGESGPIVAVSTGEQTGDPRQPSVAAEPGLNTSYVGENLHAGVHGTAEEESLLHATSATALCFSLFSDQTAPASRVAQQSTPNAEGRLAAVPSTSGNESRSYTFEVPAYDVFDYDASQDDAFCAYDDDPQNLSRSDENGPPAPALTEGQSRPVQAIVDDTQTLTTSGTHEAENYSPLGALAHAASTLSPSPCPPSVSSTPSVQEQPRHTEEVVVPPRKRRRTAVDSQAITGICVISDLAGRPKAEPRLSSSLPVAGDSSVLAYVCGHSACFPPGVTTSTACYSTSGELLSHYKEKHMYCVGASDETPFRCGLKGCNKKWKSINGLQYHLQISKVHYQHICSRVTTSRKEDTVDHDSGIDPTDERSSDDVSRAGMRRLHRCPHFGCSKAYKQLSGLRYHLLHGHPKDIPVQLNTIPPKIAKELGC